MQRDKPASAADHVINAVVAPGDDQIVEQPVSDEGRLHLVDTGFAEGFTDVLGRESELFESIEAMVMEVSFSVALLARA